MTEREDQWLDRLKAFRDAARDLDKVWADCNIGSEGYPWSKGSWYWNRELAAIEGWFEIQARLHTEPGSRKRAAMLGRWK